jgi:hypothetical protein
MIRPTCRPGQNRRVQREVLVEETAKLIVFVRHGDRTKQKARALDRARGYNKLVGTKVEGPPFVIEHARAEVMRPPSRPHRSMTGTIYVICQHPSIAIP